MIEGEYMNIGNKVVYQIYPKSFKDSNHDGLGDIAGITEKLDYLQFLGVDYIWITPIFRSPQNDNGYDVENYYEIDPLFGTMNDLEELIEKAGIRGIGIMLDMVFNHTSTEHEWFKRALAGEREYQDCYLFMDGREGQPPTNWISKFKGNAWKYVEDMDQFYLHLFHETQADLNWKNEMVRQEAANVVNFWMKKGVKGFRFDVINLIDKESFSDDPVGEGKQFYTDRPLVHQYLKELNEASFGQADDIITVGELSSTTIENCIRYTKPENKELSMVFSFHHLKVDYDEQNPWGTQTFDFQKLKKLLTDWQIAMQEGGGWNALFWCCHDQPRVLSRYGDDKEYPVESAKMLATALYLLRGTPYIYQGEEIGMTNAYFDKLEQYKDIAAINSYHCMEAEGYDEEARIEHLQNRSRDNARTPMQWSDDEYAGFGDTAPWISLAGNYRSVNVKKSIEDPDSVLHYYRRLIRLRKESEVIQRGRYIPVMEEHESIFAYKRVLDGQELLVYNNFYKGRPLISLDPTKYDILISNVKRNDLRAEMALEPYESLVLVDKKERRGEII